MSKSEDSPFSAAEIAEARRLIAATLASRGIRMEESQLDIAMRRLVLHARVSGSPLLAVAREMIDASAPTPASEE